MSVLVINVLWPLFLLSFSVFGFFGVRNAQRVGGAVLAGLVAAVLLISGVLAFWDMMHVWTGGEVANSIEINTVTIVSLLLAFAKSSSWILDVRA